MIDFWLCWVFVALCGPSLVVVSGGYTLLRCVGFLLLWLLLLQSTGSRHAGFSNCSMWAQELWLTGPRVQAHYLWLMGLVVPRHVGSSRTRDRTRVPCIGRWILKHCATRKVPRSIFYRDWIFHGTSAIRPCLPKGLYFPNCWLQSLPCDFFQPVKYEWI